MTYHQFAYLYDHLMYDVPYDDWLSFLERKIERYGDESFFTIMDLACGTGELSIKIAEKGFHVQGVDLSEHMLAVANKKAVENQLNIAFYQQSMAELTGFSNLDCIVCFCDSLNYLQTENEVKATFQKTYECLRNGGLFIFDVHSIFKISQIFMNQTFCHNDEEVSYIWNCFQGEYPNSVEHELSFFVNVNEDTNLYERFDEYHFQRTYPSLQYKSWLEEVGFTILEINGDFMDLPVSDDTERVFFTVKK